MESLQKFIIVAWSMLLSTGLAGAEAPVASFDGTPTTGPAPLDVSFFDNSYGSPDGWAWFFGDEDYGAVCWTRQNPGAGWSIRENAASVGLVDGTIVLMGGGSSTSDVWCSSDGGVTWARMTASASWPGRHSHTSVALPDGSIVLMGGWSPTRGGYTNDTWRSADKGATWTRMTPSAAWSARKGHSSAVLADGSIVLMGGVDISPGGRNDVWRSTDKGSTWALATANASWTGRFGHSSAVLPDGSIVLMGGWDGTARNDVWRSTDNGSTWALVTASADWTGRLGHSSAVLPDGSIVLMGGWNRNCRNDVWRSTDNGATWIQLNAAEWTGRFGHSSAVLPDGSIVLMGGWDLSDAAKNDVWRFVTATATQNPAHLYTLPGKYSVTLQAYNSEGYSRATRTEYITVDTLSRPMAGFTANKTSGTAPLTVAFMDESTGPPTSWSWDFGDGGTSSGQNPHYTYLSAGTYAVQLTARNMLGSDTKTRKEYITVLSPPAPVIFSITPDSGINTTTIRITNLSGANFNTAAAPVVSLTRAGWGNITATDVTTLSSTQVACTFDLAGRPAGPWDVAVTNLDKQAAILPGGFTITQPPPVANFTGVPRSGIAPLIVTFNDTSTGSPTSWTWTFGDGGVCTTRNSTHTYTSPGTYTVALSAGNTGGSNSITQKDYITVLKPSTATALTTNCTPSVYGQPIRFTAKVSPVPPGSGIPTGTVTFTDGSVTLGTVVLDSTGEGNLGISSLAVGTHRVNATYPGNANFAGSKGAILHAVDKSATATTIKSSRNPAGAGTPVTFTATVHTVAPGSGIPQGTVTFWDGAMTLGTVALSGTEASLSTPSLQAGTHTITASYSGNANFKASTGTTPQTVNPAPVITSFGPATGVRGMSMNLAILGNYIQNGTTVRFTQDSSAIPVTVKAITPPSRISGVVAIPSSAGGKWNLEVRNPDGGQCTRAGVFTIL